MRTLIVYADFNWLNDFRYVTNDASPMEYYRRTTKSQYVWKSFLFLTY